MKTTNQGALARLRSNRAVSVLVILILIGFVGAGLNTFIILRDAGYDQRYLELSSEMRLYAQQIANTSKEANAGAPSAFDELATATASFNAVRKQLSEGSRDLPAPRAMLGEELQQLDQLWLRVDSAAQTILGNREQILFLNNIADQLHILLPVVQTKYSELVEILLNNGATANQVALAQQQLWLAERIGRNIDRVLAGTTGSAEAVTQFNADTLTFVSVLVGMQEGDSSIGVKRVNNSAARALLADLIASYDTVREPVKHIREVSPQLLRSTQASSAIAVDVPKIMQISSQLSAAITELENKRPLSVLTALLFVGLIVISLGLLGWQSVQSTQRRLQSTADTNERNQTAILRLLDELADLADGDLTTSATVTEDFTGAIADSINYTIDQLRVLVSQINDTAVGVSTAAQTSQTTALNLAQASESQAKEIAGASAAITEMAVSIDQVSSNARDSAAVAQRSVVIAGTGAEVVQNTINGMDNIREQIQETSKRIKRLGESSQEIGDIVSLINDIADQTNILALNAAIQASMAGDAGRGFAVVADEVQRLAERSSGATKQIEALVKTIQSDTNEAVISMEQTTSEVVRGARLAQDAGAALNEIETVSQELAELIQNISSVAANQAESAGQISSTMKIIQQITSQTSAGSTETARSIGALAEMTNDLRSSVAGFTLPEQGS
ncbi:methyl-accepting chemotaxis protein [Spongiibacter sp. IMCC21906]|uniref:methyl-accepting chemotaxis protein n=1 Tax=Spongiibacter sp. IMCC21906 TaxID=1620392 RepID=UPI00062DE1D5|nr:methyl-accepting chemotaxis protein [Spongiibacter sp. IMCC21906]AKH67926.1 methyl-accepting chemotaxis protein [Spongiibacter sp. IMCC21906]